MGILRDAIARNGGRPPARTSAPPATPATATASPAAQGASRPGAAGGEDAHSELRRRRDALAEEVAELHWDLGGLAYEMAIRDHFRLDVLVRRAAILQERDAELAELERMLGMEQGAVAGSCPRCGAPHSRGAVYCWQCGAALMERTEKPAAAEEEASTDVMNALLPPTDPGGRPPGAGR